MKIETGFWTLYVKEILIGIQKKKNGNKRICLHPLSYIMQVDVVRNNHLYIHLTADLQIP